MNAENNITLLLVCPEADTPAEAPSWLDDAADEVADIHLLAGPATELSWAESYDTLEMVRWTEEEGLIPCLNRVTAEVTEGHILLLFADETPRLADLPGDLSNTECLKVKLIQQAEGESRHNYQVRLFPATGDRIFEGFAIPDLTRAFFVRGWKLRGEVPEFRKSSAAYSIAQVTREAEHCGHTRLCSFWKGLAAAEQRGYARAEEYFRKARNGPSLLEFDLLAAMNNLAHALVEQHKLQEAIRVAAQSIQWNASQRAPYLILQRAQLMAGNREESILAMEAYLEHLEEDTVANLDTYLGASEVHYLVGEQKLREGNYEGAFHHYGTHYRLEDGQVEQPVLEKLFIYSIELQNRDLSIRYFNDIFGEHIPDKLDDDMSARLLESLSLFMDNEWYDFVSEVYEELVTHNPGDNELLHGWITTLIKNKDIEKAQSLIKSGKSKKKAG
ncbi:MAG: hypothetical protein U5K31_00015 [Balneolaceae bacterium]|nr:hypothetical protein [Balneolaceae bacterium]